MLQLLTKAKTGPARQVLGGLIAYGTAEIAVRGVRLVTVLITARQLAPAMVGVAALTLTLFEIIRVLMNLGIGQQIIACSEADKAATCNTARTLFWRWSFLVMLIQLLVAGVLGVGLGQVDSAWMLAILSLVYLSMPAGLVQCYLLMREGRAAVTARTAAIQTISDHLLTAGLLLAWPNPWSVALPKLLTAPLWLILTRHARPWKPDPLAGHVPAKAMMRFGSAILVNELAQAVRNQCDKLIVGATLGVSALGTYFFAFNAGIGIMSSLISAFGTVLFPIICAAPKGRPRTILMLKLVGFGGFVFLPAIGAQSSLAHLYVPIIFGQKWDHAADLIAILCLAGIPMLATSLVTTWLRAEGRPGLDAKVGSCASLLSLFGLYLGIHFSGLSGAATGWVFGLSVVSLPFACSLFWSAFRSTQLPLSYQEVRP